MDEERDDLLASLELGARRRLLELQLPRAVPVFISCAPEDDDLRKELYEHLHGLVHDKGLISSFSRPGPGDGTDENTNQIVARVIDDAEVVLLLVTPSFLASRACMNLDVPRIMARSEVGRAHVVPILAHACELSGTPVAGMHMHPLDGGPIASRADRDAAWREVVREVASLAGSVQARQVLRKYALSAPAVDNAQERREPASDILERVLDGCTPGAPPGTPAWYESEVAAAEKAFGSADPKMESILEDMARVAARAGAEEAGRALMERSIALAEKRCGKDHLTVADRLAMLAAMIEEAGRPEQALPLMQRVVYINLGRLGSTHPDVADWLFSLATLWRTLGLPDQALTPMQRAVDVLERAGPRYDHRLAFMRRKLAELRKDLAGPHDTPRPPSPAGPA